MKKDTLCIITARQGSKGIKNKNIAKLNNKPLLIHSLDFAKRLKFVAKIIISTDSKKYASLCNSNSFKIDHLRPKRLARDNTKTINVLRYELDKLNDLA